MENQNESILGAEGLSISLEETNMEALRQSDPANAKDIEAKAHSALLLSLGDQVLREVSDETLALAIPEKLQVL